MFTNTFVDWWSLWIFFQWKFKNSNSIRTFYRNTHRKTYEMNYWICPLSVMNDSGQTERRTWTRCTKTESKFVHLLSVAEFDRTEHARGAQQLVSRLFVTTRFYLFFFSFVFVGHLFSCIVFCCFFIFILLNSENSMVELSLVCDVEDKNQFVGITEHCMAKPKDCASTHTRRSHNVEGNELNDH